MIRVTGPGRCSAKTEQYRQQPNRRVKKPITRDFQAKRAVLHGRGPRRIGAERRTSAIRRRPFTAIYASLQAQCETP